MPIQNFALVTPPAALASAAAAAATASGSSNQTLRCLFGPISGTTPSSSIDMSSMAQNPVWQSCEGARMNFQLLAAATAAAKAAQKNFRISEDGKPGGADSSAVEDERKSLAGKAPGGVGQSIAFTRSDLGDAPVTSIQANNVIESSARSLNVSSGPARSSRSVTTNATGAINVPNAHIQAQLHQQQMLQLKQQQQLAATAVNRSKVPVSSNGSIYSEHLNSSPAMAAKFPNALSGFPQNLIQSNSSSPTQSPQWKSSARTPTSQSSSPRFILQQRSRIFLSNILDLSPKCTLKSPLEEIRNHPQRLKGKHLQVATRLLLPQ
ncbi:UNVERIFIED_CONTAM: hypothetical protein Sangu_1111600 [Sesamum angustifolium]|uniref:Uncharacterized protein n=1 Tax=Sesamum angustifolium TaxID=2727405 RepID=A0AAW2P011_9LAMI